MHRKEIFYEEKKVYPKITKLPNSGRNYKKNQWVWKFSVITMVPPPFIKLKTKKR